MDASELTVDDERQVLTGDLVDGYRLCTRVTTRIYREGDEFVASLVDFPINAFGPSRDEAIQRLREEIVGHLRWLEDAGDKLSPHLIREREQLEAAVRRTCA